MLEKNKPRIKARIKELLKAAAESPLNINKAIRAKANSINVSPNTAVVLYYSKNYEEIRNEAKEELIEESKVFFIKGISGKEQFFTKNSRENR